jgi:hypothetical protein
MAGHQRGLGIKNGDNFTIPLCRTHHDKLHMFGSEELFLALHGIDGVKIASDLWNGEPDD